MYINFPIRILFAAGNNKQVILASPSLTSSEVVKKTVVGPASSIMIGKKFDGSPTLKGPKEETGAVKILNQSQNSPSSNLHAVNIPGKGVQIVRILNTGVNTASSTLTSLTTTTSQILQKPQNHIVTKISSLPTSGIGETKLLLKNKDGQTVTVLQKSPMTAIKKPTFVTSQEKTTDIIKTEVVKRSAITTVNANSDEPAQKKTKYITLTSAQINQIQGEITEIILKKLK